MRQEKFTKLNLIPYVDRLDLFDYIQDVYDKQGKTTNNCTGMSSFSFVKEHITFLAGDDCLIPAHQYPY